MSKKGTDYELFVKDVYECLNKADGLNNVRIQHDVKLTGAAGVEHQIDVYWSFKIGGVDYKVAIECKDYNSHVSKEKIEAFHAILNDIGNVHGIFASRMGFQRGAIKYAKRYGIQLMEIRHPIDVDWEGKLKNIHLELITHTITNVCPQIFVNKERAEEMNLLLPERKRFNSMSDSVEIEFDRMSACEKVFTEDKKTMLEMLGLIQAYDTNAGIGKKQVFSFVNGIITLNGLKLPIDAIEFSYDIREYKDNMHINGDEVIRAIVKNITEKTEVHIDKFGRVNEV